MADQEKVLQLKGPGTSCSGGQPLHKQRSNPKEHNKEKADKQNIKRSESVRQNGSKHGNNDQEQKLSKDYENNKNKNAEMQENSDISYETQKYSGKDNISNKGKSSKARKSLNQSRQSSRQPENQKTRLISAFDKVEEVRFKAYETSQTLNKLVGIIEQTTKENEDDCISSQFLFTLPPETWQEIRELATQVNTQFQDCSGSWDSIVESLAQDMQRYKQRCNKLKSKIETINSESYTQNKDQEYEFEKSLNIMVKTYNKTYQQIFNMLDDYELVQHDMKNGFQRRNVQKLGLMTQLDREVDDIFSEIVSKSGRIIHNALSHRGNGGDSYRSKIQPTQQENDKLTPRSMQQPPISARRGRSQLAPQQSARAVEVISTQQEPKKISIPLLPIHMINNKKDNQLSSRGGINSNRNSYIQAQQNSSRLAQQISARQQLSSRVHQLSSRRQIITPRPIDSKRSISQAGENQGGIIDGEYLVNPVFLGAAHQTSQFDKALENDFECAEETLTFDTERLKCYEEEYEALMQIENEDERILLKQLLFFAHEKEIKKQIKKERQQRLLLKQQARQNQKPIDGTTPRLNNPSHANSQNENDQTLKEPSLDNPRERQVSRRHNSSNGGSSNMIQEAINMASSLNASHISLQRQLPMLGTLELISARRKEMLNDVELNQLLDVEIEIEGLMKTATEKAIIVKIEQEYKEKEDMMKENRKVLEWSCSGGEEVESDGRRSVAQSIKTKKDENSNVVSARNQRVYSNGAINIVDMQIQQTGFEVYGGNQFVGELNQENDQYSSSCLSMNSSEILEQYKLKHMGALKDQLSPDTEEEYKPLINEKDIVFQKEFKEIEPKLFIETAKDQLEIIQERQSEFSSSYNTNKIMSRINSNRSKSRQNQDSRIMDVVQDSSRPGLMRIQSARETPCNKNIDFNKIQYFAPGMELDTDRQSKQQDAEQREEKYKRCKSHRQSLQSAPNSQRGSIHSKNKQEKCYNDLKFNLPQNNFHSIQVDETFEEIKAQKPKKLNEKLNKNSLENSISQQNIFNIEDNEASSPQDKQKFRKDKKRIKDYDFIDIKYSPKHNENHFSSIQNHFEESKTSSFKNESFDLDGSVKFLKREAFSDRDLRENDDMCESDDIDFNHVQIYNRMIPLSYLKELSQVQEKGGNIDFNEFSRKINNLYQNQPRNQHNNSLLLGNQSIQQPFNQNFQQSRFITNSHQLTANMINNFLQNQTHLKMHPGQSTKDVPTCKRNDQRVQLNGQGGFTLSNFGDETLMYMFPAQKTQRRTLFMLQNFNNNYYNNCAGVLFTMPSGEMNNGFLQQCSTVPSDPELCSGGMTIQEAGGQSNTKIQHNINYNTQESIMRDDNILQGLQRYCMPHFYGENNRFTMSKNALSTEESAFKSTNFPMRFTNNQQLFSNKQESTLSPKISFDTVENQTKTSELFSRIQHYPFQQQRPNDTPDAKPQNNIFQRNKVRSNTTNGHQSAQGNRDQVNQSVIINGSNGLLRKIQNQIQSQNKSFVNQSFSPATGQNSSTEKPKTIFNRNIRIAQYSSAQNQIVSDYNSGSANLIMKKQIKKLNIVRPAGFTNNSSGLLSSDNETSFSSSVNQIDLLQQQLIQQRRRESLPIKF